MLLSALLFGVLGSFHCIGMCGPIAFMLPIESKNSWKGFLQILSYHSGRLFTYSFMGLLFGFLGKSFQFLGFQQYLSIFVGTLMIILIIFPRVTKKLSISKYISTIIIKVKSALGKELASKNKSTFFTLGFLNGFLPCGLVYMAIIGALTTTNALTGSLYMLLFGFGTIPLMTAVIYLGNFSKGTFRKKVVQLIPVVVVCIGVLFILRGLGLGIPYVSPKPILDTVNSGLLCH
jgi:sulfite exporter TauE/SafE